MRPWAIIAAAAALLAAYFVAPPILQKEVGQPSTTATQSQPEAAGGLPSGNRPSISTTATQSQPAQGATSTLQTTSSPAAGRPTPSTSSAASSPAATTNPLTTTPSSSPPQRSPPSISISLLTKAVNLTRLPAPANLTFSILNDGAAAASVDINGTLVVVQPNSSRLFNTTARVSSAGPQSVLLVINGTPRAFAFTAYYFAPAFAAEPLSIAVRSLPAVVAANVAIRNIGNYTGFINGTAVPPGGSITVPLRLNIAAAGSYTVSVGGVPVAVNVAYLAVGYKATLSSPPVEALPGEPVSAALEVANTGNATISLSINGTYYQLQPRRSLEVNFTIPAQAHRQIILYINNTKYIWNLNISIIFIFVLFKINGQIYNPLATRSIVVSASQSQIQYQWVIKSNATRRAVAVEAGGSLYLLRPGSALLINGTLSASLNNWNAVSLAVNGTQYAVDLYVELTPSTINVRSINSITFTDNRTFYESASCSNTPIGAVTFNVEVYSMSGTITYSGNTISFSGSVTLYVDKLGKTITASYSGSSTNGVGQVSATVGSYTITVYFSGGSVTSITVNGQQVSCGASIIPIPPFMYQMPPTGSMDVASLGAQLANLFARGGQDLIAQAYYNGQSVVLIDGAGNTMSFNFNGGLSISGRLSASASAQIS